MRVPARVFADAELLEAIRTDRSLEQLQNVATLPGVVGAALAMPDIHQGYGFPVGGLAATEPPDGVDLPRRGRLRHQLRRAPAGDRDRSRRAGRPQGVARPRDLPPGAGGGGPRGRPEAERSRARPGPARGPGGPAGAPRHRHRRRPGAHRVAGTARCAPTRTPSPRGRASAAPASSARWARATTSSRCSGWSACSTKRCAQAYGLEPGAVTVLIHSGSRGLGHQVCTDYVKRMDATVARHGIELPDRQLACAPLSAPEAQDYLARWRRRPTSPGRTAPRSRTPSARRSAPCWARRRRRHPAGLRRGPQRRQARALWRQGALRAPKGRHPRLPAGPRRDPARLSGGRAARLHSRLDGHLELRPGRSPGVHGAVVRHHLPRRGAQDEPHRGAQADPGRRASPPARSGRDHGPLPVEPGPRRGGAVRLQGRGGGGRGRRARRARAPAWPSCARSGSSRGEATAREIAWRSTRSGLRACSAALCQGPGVRRGAGISATAAITAANARQRATTASGSFPTGSPKTRMPPAIEAQFAATEVSAITGIASPVCSPRANPKKAPTPATIAISVQGLRMVRRSPGTVPVSALTETLATPSSRPAATAQQRPAGASQRSPRFRRAGAAPRPPPRPPRRRSSRRSSSSRCPLRTPRRSRPRAPGRPRRGRGPAIPEARRERRTSAGPTRRAAPGRPRWSSRPARSGPPRAPRRAGPRRRRRSRSRSSTIASETAPLRSAGAG